MLTKTQNEANDIVTIVWKWNEKTVREYSYSKKSKTISIHEHIVSEIDKTLWLLIETQNENESC